MAREETHRGMKNGNHRVEDDSYDTTVYRDLPYPVNNFTSHALSSNPGILNALEKVLNRIRNLEAAKQNAKERFEREVNDRGKLQNHGQPNVSEELAAAVSRCRIMEEQLQHFRHQLQKYALSGDSRHLDYTSSTDSQPTPTKSEAKKTRNTWSDEFARKHEKSQTNGSEKVRTSIHTREKAEIPSKDRSHSEESDMMKRRSQQKNTQTDPSDGRRTRSACVLQKKLTNSHYHMHLRDLPFLLGRSTGPSFSLPANIQKVISMMKTHSSQLCSGMEEVKKEPRRIASYPHEDDTAVMNWTVESKEEIDVKQLLLDLQDEYGQMSLLRVELVREIENEEADHIRQILNEDLKDLVEKLEAKGKQIETLSKIKRELKQLRETGAIPNSPHGFTSETNQMNKHTYYKNLLTQTKKIQSILNIDKK